MRVQKTKNYGLFQTASFNREINKNHLQKLIKEIERRDLSEYYPIICDSSFVIMDGQHRFQALKTLGLGVSYITVDEYSLLDLVGANNTVKKWAVMDYVNVFAHLGNPNYLCLLEDVKKYGFTASCIFQILYNNTNLSKIKEGSLVYGVLEQGYVKSFARKHSIFDNLPFSFDFRFIRAFKRMISRVDYSHEQMVHQAQRYSDILRKRSGWFAYYQDLLKLYGYKKPPECRLEITTEDVKEWEKTQ